MWLEKCTPKEVFSPYFKVSEMYLVAVVGGKESLYPLRVVRALSASAN